MGNFADVNLKITAAEDENETVAVKVLRPIKSDTEVAT
jgi:hypothetical protein